MPEISDPTYQKNPPKCIDCGLYNNVHSLSCYVYAVVCPKCKGVGKCLEPHMWGSQYIDAPHIERVELANKLANLGRKAMENELSMKQTRIELEKEFKNAT